MRVASIRVDFKAGPVKKHFRIPLRTRPGAQPVVVRGSLRAAVAQALAASKREDRSWAVIQAAAGRFHLVPLWINRASDDPQVDDLGELVNVPGLRRVSVERTRDSLVAITGEDKAYMLGTGRAQTIRQD